MNKKSELKPTIDEVIAALGAARMHDDLFSLKIPRMLQARVYERGLGVDDLQSRLKGHGIRHEVFSIDDASAAEQLPRSTHSSACEICVNTVLKR